MQQLTSGSTPLFSTPLRKRRMADSPGSLSPTITCTGFSAAFLPRKTPTRTSVLNAPLKKLRPKLRNDIDCQGVSCAQQARTGDAQLWACPLLSA